MNKHPLRPVTPDDITRFKQDGAICVRNVFDREWCERMNAAMSAGLATPASLRSKIVSATRTAALISVSRMLLCGG